MNFEQFKNTYFNGDENAAIRGLVKDSKSFDNYALTGSREEFTYILDCLNEEQAIEYADILFEEIEIAGAEADIARDMREKILSARLVENVVITRCRTLLNLILRRNPAESVENKSYYITIDTVVDKKYKEGNYETLSECVLFFRDYGKYRLPLYEKDIYRKIANGDNCYLLKIAGKKKIIALYSAKTWRVSDKDFYFANGRYLPRRNIDT